MLLGTRRRTENRNKRNQVMRKTECGPIKNPKDVKKLITVKNARDRLLFCLGLFTGLRIQEILSIKWYQLVTDSGNPASYSNFYIPKQNISRRISFHHTLRDAIANAYKGQGPESLVFPGRIDRSKPLTTQGVNTCIVKAYINQLDIDMRGYNNSSHCLRKTFGYHHYKQHKDITLLMSIFGHKDQATTMRYIGITHEGIANSYMGMSYFDELSLEDMIQSEQIELTGILNVVQHMSRPEAIKNLAKYLETIDSEKGESCARKIIDHPTAILPKRLQHLVLSVKS